jgi:hypothetical protein
MEGYKTSNFDTRWFNFFEGVPNFNIDLINKKKSLWPNAVKFGFNNLTKMPISLKAEKIERAQNTYQGSNDDERIARKIEEIIHAFILGLLLSSPGLIYALLDYLDDDKFS